MSSGELSMKYGHTEGHTEVCFNATGSLMLSSGSDGQVRIWEDFENNQNPRVLDVGDKVYGLTIKDDIIYAATDNNSIEKYNLADGSPDGVLMRFTSNATQVTLAECQNTIAAGSSDFTAKLIDLTTSEQKVFDGHKAPVLSAAPDPLDEYLATVSCDGNFCIWNVSDSDCVESISVIRPSNDVCNSESLSRLSWRPATGEDIAVPSGNEVKVFARGTWSLVHSFKTALTKKAFNCCAFSLCGRFLAAATVDGWICVWDAETQDCLQTIQHSLRTCICSLVWDPRENNIIAVADVRGQVGLLKEAVPLKVKTNQNSVPDDLDALFEDEDGDINDFLDDAAAESNDGKDDLPNLKKKKRENLIDSDNEDDDSGGKKRPAHSSDFEIPSTNNLFAVDDDLAPPVIPSVKPPLDPLDDASSSISGLQDDQDKAEMPRQAYTGPTPTPMQPSFQPGATPSYLSHRFMVWNPVGTIRSYTDETESAIDIEFHDKQHHYALHINNEAPGGGAYNTMADLSMNAIAFAAEATEDVPSKLTCIHYASWEGNKEWSVEMPDDEDVKALTIGESWVAACTDARLVRMFSLSGMQRLLFSIPGPVVSMSAHTDQLFIVYHLTQGFNGNQCLGFMLLEVGVGTGPNKPKKIVGGEPLPLSKKSSLQWIGFTAEGTPVTVDTAGVVRIMNRGFSNTWIPISYLKKLTKSRHDHYWVVGLHENPQELRCILCKGSTYPTTLPRPFPTILSYNLPMCESNAEKTKFEEEYWRTRIFSSHFEFLESHGFETDTKHQQSVEVLLQQTMMKMFALACKTDRESRALEICNLMPSSSSVNLAIKYASRLKRIILAQKLSEVAQEKTQEEMEALLKLQRRQQMGGYEEDEDDQQEDFRAEMQAGYSHTNTEWEGHKKRSLAKKKLQKQEDSDMEEDVEDNIEIRRKDLDSDDLPDLGKPRKTATAAPTSLRLSGSSRNPFKKKAEPHVPMPSQSAKEAVSTSSSVLDSISKKPSVSQKLRGVIAKSHSLTKKSVTSKDTKKQQTLFGSNSKFQLTSTPKGKKQGAFRQEDEQPSVNKQILRDVKNESTTGVQLYVSEVRQKLSEENPDLDGVEVRKLAIGEFRKLTSDERKIWNEKAKHTVVTEAIVTTSAKRKFESDDEEATEDGENTPDVIEVNGDAEVSEPPHNKLRKVEETAGQKPTSTANSKLAAFAFASED